LGQVVIVVCAPLLKVYVLVTVVVFVVAPDAVRVIVVVPEAGGVTVLQFN